MSSKILVGFLLKETVHEHTHDIYNYSFYFSHMPMKNYITITFAVFIFEAG